jgi:Cys-rich four helix bundle protein (predicted Tat secretion target)
MERRDFFKAAGAAVLVAASTKALAEDMDMSKMPMDHEHMMHMGNPPNAKLQDTALNCVKAGQVCINHCLDSYAMGDLSMAGCARTVDQMLAVCSTLAKLASVGSPHLARMAKVAYGMCKDCEKECRKHADQHAECKACADACAACAEECEKVAA